MKTIIEKLHANGQVSGYKINRTDKESYELFYVLGKLETVRRTRTTDKQVTVYVDHDGMKGDAQFFVYPSTDEAQLETLIAEAVDKAALISNAMYDLPEAETGDYTVESNFADYEVTDLAAQIAQTVFAANTVDNGSLNAVEIFINKYTETVLNSRGLHKTQHRYDAMVEAIPTYNGEELSVELYEQYNFASFDRQAMTDEIAGKMAEVRARYEAKKPDAAIDCPVILNYRELTQLCMRIAGDLNYASVYSHSNLFQMHDAVQKDASGDLLNLRMAGEIPGSVRSAKFDSDGLSLVETQLLRDGKVVGYYGSNRYGQYLGMDPTGELRCIKVEPGTAKAEDFTTGPYLEIISMSGLQVDFFKNYIGGEVRLAYYHDGESVTPVTGISISGALDAALSCIRLSEATLTAGAWSGPAKAILTGMKVF